MVHGGDATLDPDDWPAFRGLAHRMLDDLLDSFERVRTGPAWQAMPDAIRQALHTPLPREGLGVEEVYRRFTELVLPFTNGNRHPRFFGWVQGNGTPLGAMADLLAAGMNPHCAGFAQASTEVEHRVLEWLRELMGFPPETSGLLVSGGTMANFVGLAAARDAAPGAELWQRGLVGRAAPLCCYASTEVHGWLPKSMNLLGLGNDALRSVPVDEEFRIRVDLLRAAITADRARGAQPFCVVASAGTVNTGACDDLDALADLCGAERMWLHVDGAFGAWAKLSSTHAPLVRGMERADSLGFDLHKWGYLPFEVACVLVRDAAAHTRPFAIRGGYLAGLARGPFATGIPFASRGLELTRSFKALKVWMSLLAHGVDRLAALIDQNLAQAARLRDLVAADPWLELLAPVPLNVVCLRAVAPGRSDAELDAANHELLFRIQESGYAVPSHTTIHGRFGLRAAITNHRTTGADIDGFAARVGEVARQVLA